MANSALAQLTPTACKGVIRGARGRDAHARHCRSVDSAARPVYRQVAQLILSGRCTQRATSLLKQCDVNKRNFI